MGELDRRANDGGYSPNNCRFVTVSANRLNARLLSSNNTSGYRGVTYSKQTGSYSSTLKVRGKQYRKSGFATAEEAAKARDLKCIELNLHTPLNFPELKK